MLNLGIIIGAQKCGTTALHLTLGRHHQIAASDPKEPYFFSDLSKFNRGEEYYRSLFPFRPEHNICLDSSTHYSMYPFYTGVPNRMKDTNWNVRFVYVLRNPIERIQSFYLHLAIMHMHGVPPLSDGLHPFPLMVSSYFTQLEVYREVFGREPMLIIMHGEMKTNPSLILRRILAHFGVDQNSSIALRTIHGGEAEYERTLIIEEWRRRGNAPLDLGPSNLYKYMQRLPDAERRDIHRSVRALYTLTEDHKSEIRTTLATDMKSLRNAYGVEVSRWGF